MSTSSQPPNQETDASTPYQQVFVQPEDRSGLRVTFDDNKSNNVWSYHVASNRPHITEIFQVQQIGLRFKVLTFPIPPSQDQLQLSVREDTIGVTDRYPRFRQSRDKVDDVTIHTEFTREDEGGKTAFSFVTERDSTKVYLGPTSNNLSRIETKVTDAPQYYFVLGPLLSLEAVEKIAKDGGCGRGRCLLV